MGRHHEISPPSFSPQQRCGQVDCVHLASSASGRDPEGGSVSSGRARAAAGKVLAEGIEGVAIKIIKMQRLLRSIQA